MNIETKIWHSSELQTQNKNIRVANAHEGGDKYYIVESKFGTSELSKVTNDGPQMSDAWIEDSNRIYNVVGDRAIELEIINSGYTRVLSKISDDGNIVFKELDNLGNEIGEFIF